MPRRPPIKPAAKKTSGPRDTRSLPDDSDARRTWSGPPHQRSPGRWSGAVEFGGAKHWVGTESTPARWGQARDRKLAELRDERAKRALPGTALAVWTIAQFVGPPGEGWPWDFQKNGRRRERSTFEHHEQCIRPLVAAFGDLPLKGGLERFEAIKWSNHATENQLTSAIAMFNDANFVDETVLNPLRSLSRRRTRGRADMPYVLTEEE
jgi:hypothetical protein